MPNPSNKIAPERVRACAALYHSNANAARALGIKSSSFSRLCRRYGVEQPGERRERQHRELMAQRGRAG